MKRKMLLFALVLPSLFSLNAKAQTGSRLTASSDWVFNGVSFVPVDSSFYNYSGGRGGDLTHPMQYDNGTKLEFIDTTGGYMDSAYYIQTFDANNNLIEFIYEDYSSGTPVYSYLYSYNSSNQLDTMTLQTWNGGSWTPVSQDVYSYNTAGKMYLDVYSLWSAGFVPYSQKTYVYDPTNTYVLNETDESLVSSTPVYTNEYIYNYSGSELLSEDANVWDGSGWDSGYQIQYTYDGTGDMITRQYNVWDNGALAYDNDSLYTYTYSGSTVPASMVVQTWNVSGGSWTNLMQYMYTYNSFNQLTSSTGTAWNVVGLYEHANGDPMANYYYSTYTPGVSSVKNVSNTGGDANIYPVPAQSILHINVSWNEAQASTIAIYDVTGNVIRQWQAPSGTQYNSAISVSGFADGAYFVKINGAQGQIVKQIVVSH